MERLAPLSWKELNGEGRDPGGQSTAWTSETPLDVPVILFYISKNTKFHQTISYKCVAEAHSSGMSQLLTSVRASKPSMVWPVCHHGRGHRCQLQLGYCKGKGTLGSSCWCPLCNGLLQGHCLLHTLTSKVSSSAVTVRTGQRAAKLSGCMGIHSLSIISPLQHLDTPGMAEG